MSALFASYEQEVNTLVTSLKARATNPDERFAEDLREAEALVTQLELESRSTSTAADIKVRVSRLREEIKSLRERFVLLGGGKGGKADVGRPNRANMREDDEALTRSARALADSRRTLMETETIAAGISEDLLEHRATILSSREKLLHTGGLLGRAHRTMRIMQNRDVQRKMCVYGAVGFVVLMFIVFVIRELFPSSSATPVDTLSPTLAPSMPPTVV